MAQEFEPVIGLEIHAELETKSKMFCACPVVDTTLAEANAAVCPVCSGMPGVLPVVNQRAVEYALCVALALECDIPLTSIFARKNYFYPDLPKGYQISQYEQPLARHGRLAILTSHGERVIRIRRVHLEEDTGKLTHVGKNGQSYSLVDLNRAGIPLLEIVSEPDLRSAEEVRVFATALRSILRYLEVSSGDMQKGVMRIEPNVSVRPVGSQELNTRTEVKNLNSFRALERSVAYEIQRQGELLRQGLPVLQETLGWDESREMTVSQRSKEYAHDYRYFPEPDLPPLVISQDWVEEIRSKLPELPEARRDRFIAEHNLTVYDANLLTSSKAMADYFEACIKTPEYVKLPPDRRAKEVSNWLLGEFSRLLNATNTEIKDSRVTPEQLCQLLDLMYRSSISGTTAKLVFEEMFNTGKHAADIIAERGLSQISDTQEVREVVSQVIAANAQAVADYKAGKTPAQKFLVGQVMKATGGRANPKLVNELLEKKLKEE